MKFPKIVRIRSPLAEFCGSSHASTSRFGIGYYAVPNAAYEEKRSACASEGKEILHPKRLHLLRGLHAVADILSVAVIVSYICFATFDIVSVAFILSYILFATFFEVIPIGILVLECSRYSNFT